MNVQISKDAARIIRSCMQGGRFASETEVVEEALRLMDRQGSFLPVGAARTEEEFQRRLVAIGLMSPSSGGVAAADPDDELMSIEGEPLSETVVRERR